MDHLRDATGVTTPTGNVTMDPDSVWYTDAQGNVKRRPESEWRPVNPQNIAEDIYHGGKLKGRRKFGKIFDEEAKAQVEEEARRPAVEEVVEDEVEVAHLTADENEDTEIGEVLNLDDVEKTLETIKILAKSQDDPASDEQLLDIAQAEYKRAGGPRRRVIGALSALGYKKPK